MFRSVRLSAVLALGSVGVVSAISLSSQCQSSLLVVASSPDAACLNVQGLVPLLTASSNTSLVTPVSNWLAGACAADPCTNDQLAALVANVTTGCGNDLSGLGFTSEDVPLVTSAIQQYYPTARKIACLKDTTNNTLCVTNLLSQIETVTGPLSIDNIVSQVPAAVFGQDTALVNSTVCSDCVKAAYNVLREDLPELVADDSVTASLSENCGASFVDGTNPTQIVLGTGTAAPTAAGATGDSNGVASISPAFLGVAASSLAALSAAFVILA